MKWKGVVSVFTVWNGKYLAAPRNIHLVTCWGVRGAEGEASPGPAPRYLIATITITHYLPLQTLYTTQHTYLPTMTITSFPSVVSTHRHGAVSCAQGSTMQSAAASLRDTWQDAPWHVTCGPGGRGAGQGRGGAGAGACSRLPGEYFHTNFLLLWHPPSRVRGAVAGGQISGHSGHRTLSIFCVATHPLGSI